MRRICSSYALFWVLLAIPAVSLGQKATLQPLFTVDLAPLAPQGPQICLAGALTFLTDHTLAVTMCGNSGCNLETIDISGNQPQRIAQIARERGYNELFRGPEGRLVLGPSAGSRTALLLEPNLQEFQALPTKVYLPYISTTGETFAQQLSENDWAIFKTVRPAVRILSGNGSVLSVSDDAVAYLDQGMVKITGMDGKSLGTFAVKTRSFARIMFLGRDRLLLEISSGAEIRDFNGKALRKLEREDGWGFRLGQSSDGSRLLFDRYTRHVPLTQSIKEYTIAVASLGLGVGDEVDNGEMVRVMDTNSGKMCFEWNGSTNVLLSGGYHADISPSSGYVAVMDRTSLTLYRIPEVCSGR